ncbi:MAG: family 10 glycosylhydrolase [Marinifilaceae bacterium]|jgi:uncharacterized lipoprotein YddW (UPF0748 family)
MKNLFAIVLVGLLALGGCKQVMQQESKETPKYWIWMHSNDKNTDADWDKVFTRVADAGIQAVLFLGNEKQLKQVIPIAGKHQLDVHAWMWAMNCNDPEVVEKHPEWLSVNREGKSLAEQKAYVDYYKFMCPSLPEVREYLKEKVKRLSKIKGLKGIHLDYIRYVDVILPEAIQPDYQIVQDHEFPEYDYGYHPYTRKLYKEKYGIDPMDIEDPENDQQWKQFRYNQVSEAVAEMQKVAHKYNKPITAAVFPSPSIARKLVRQDWDKWPLDYVFPMVYQNFYYGDMKWIENVIQEDVASLPADKGVFCGLFAPALKDGKLTEAINVALNNGAKGIAMFDYQSISEEQWKELKAAFKK